MAGPEARPERGNTKMAKNGPETTEQQRVGLGGRHGADPMPRMSGGSAEAGRLVFHFFLFFNYSTLGLFPIYFRPFHCVSLPPGAVEDAACYPEVQRAVGTEAPAAVKT